MPEKRTVQCTCTVHTVHPVIVYPWVFQYSEKMPCLLAILLNYPINNPAPPPPPPPMTNTRWGSGRLRDSIAANQTTFSLTIRKLYLKKKGEKGGQDTRRVFTAIFSIIIFRFDVYRKGLLFTYCF